MKRYDIIDMDKTWPVKDIYDLLKIHFNHAEKNNINNKSFCINVLDIMHYSDYQGCYAIYKEGQFVNYDINNCDKTSPFWQALWKLEKHLKKNYAVNFNDIRFSFWYRNSITFTKLLK